MREKGEDMKEREGEEGRERWRYARGKGGKDGEGEMREG